MSDTTTLSGFTDLDVLESFCKWFRDVRPSKLVSLQNDPASDDRYLREALSEVSPQKIWVEYTDGFSAIFNAEAAGLLNLDSLSLPRDAHGLRVYVTESVLPKDAYEYGVITGGLFACEDCNQTDPEVPHKSCALCDHTGPVWMTVYDESAREELNEFFEDLGLDIPNWLPLA